MAVDILSEDQRIWRKDRPVASSGPFLTGPSRSWYVNFKFLAEFTFALTLLIITAPLLLLAAVLVKLTSRGPVFYSQVRLGRFGQPFTIYMLRTMHHNCESQSGPQWSIPGDSRVTPIGRILRRTHLDELPQLWNVLRGDMSLVGPRPERPEFVPQLERVLPCYRDRLLVRPGITGLAQIQLPPDTDLKSVRRKLAHDLYYVRKVSLWLDLRIIICTGCNFLFIPCGLFRKLLLVPGGEKVERSYENEFPPVPELQPA
jgi:lipopolysaccharide/colanic/teichoic acid biosynthesis glycosyltransferase